MLHKIRFLRRNYKHTICLSLILCAAEELLANFSAFHMRKSVFAQS